MDDRTLAQIAQDPRYLRLVQGRERFAWILASIVLIAYFGFILTIAFDKAVLAQPIGSGVTSLGIAAGFGVILLAIALTGVYVRRANRDFDKAVAELVAEYGQ